MTQSMDEVSEIGSRVLKFYRQLPFNVTGNVETMAAEIKSFDSLSEYPPLTRILGPRTHTLDVGCGGGWLSNSIAYHCKAPVVGIDFNPVAIEFARSVAEHLGTGARFEQADLFRFVPERPFDAVISLGVLHHTADCLGAIRHLCRHAVRQGGFLFIGLYHLYGRRPFLEHFARMKINGASEVTMLHEFTRLIGDQTMDQTHLMSWFRDQVQHPHETSHTLAELAGILAAEGFELLATSIDNYAQIVSLDEVLVSENTLESVGRQRLAEGRYYPGFFCVLARHRS